MNGINITGFITSGKPKIIGSLTLNKPGIRPPLPTALTLSDLHINNISIASGRVIPVPPKKIIKLAKS